MAKVRRPAPAPAAQAPAAKVKKAAPAVPAAAIVIEIPSSPDPAEGGGATKGSGKKRGRKRQATIDLDGVEMWTPREKRRLDDDCQILPGDPLAAAAVAPAGDDDIAVVAERGKVACRDYPHPRSACAKHPFGTTPHELHCEQCFCYVCDIAAPCVSWKGAGGHCHASDKEQRWKTLRFTWKKANQARPL